MIKISSENLLFLATYITLLIVMTLMYLAEVSIYNIFYLIFFVFFLLKTPSKAISPLSFFYGYYGVFYVLSPIFASRYQEGTLKSSEYSLSFLFVYIVFGMGVFLISKGENRGLNSRIKYYRDEVNYNKIWVIIFLLFLISTLLIYLIVSSTGGLQRWINAPGEAFLNRGGSGVYVILSHFSSEILAALVGFYSYNTKKYYWLYIFIAWVLVTSPVHGSKLQISLLLILSFLPWINRIRFFSLQSLTFFGTFVLLFFLGLYFRNLSWIDASSFLPYALNYFTALENLAISIKDFQPDFLVTWFLPFNKFLSPFGLLRPDFYFDMNHWLTDIYYPQAWEKRATEQWPVETDLYLNFYFVGGLPLVGLYLYIVGYLYGYARKAMSLGAWFVAIILTVGLISHLRGSLYNFVDFYTYPFIIFSFYFFKKYKINDKEM